MLQGRRTSTDTARYTHSFHQDHRGRHVKTAVTIEESMVWYGMVNVLWTYGGLDDEKWSRIDVVDFGVGY